METSVRKYSYGDALADVDAQLKRIDNNLRALGGGTKQHTVEDAGVEVHRLMREYMSRTGETDYAVAFAAVRRDPKNVAVIRAYAAS